MRNLSRYPITMQEIIDCLELLADEINPEGPEMQIGDMRPLLLQKAAQILRRVDFAVFTVDGVGVRSRRKSP